MSTYVISDIHGEYNMFCQLLNKIQFCDKDTLYILGDAIDRGPHPIQVLQKMQAYPNIIPLVGNHELMALSCLRLLMKEVTDENIPLLDHEFIQKLLDWQENGGNSTIKEFSALPMNEKEELIDYLMNFDVYEELRINDLDFLLVHAGLNHFQPNRDLDDYELDELVWTRPNYEQEYFSDKYIVSGHTPTQMIPCHPNPGYIYKRNHHIAIDCGACFGGRLAAICLDTMEEFYVHHEKETS